jgi:hypothetical protein
MKTIKPSTADPSAIELIARAVPLGARINPPVQITPVLQSIGSGAETQLQGGLPTKLPLLTVIARLRYRAIVTTAATAVNADGPLGLITNLRVVGQHIRAGTQTKINASAADLESLNQAFFGHPLFSNGANLALGTATGNYDMDLRFGLPLSYVEALAQRHWERLIEGLLNGPDYSRIDLFATFGGFGDLFTGGAGSVTGYGGSGNPQLSFEHVQVRIGRMTGFRPFFVERIAQTLPASSVATAGTDIEIYPKLQVGNDLSYSSLFLKQYVPAAGSSNAATLLDGANEVVTRYRLKVDGVLDVAKSTPGAAQYLTAIAKPQARLPGRSLLDWTDGNPDAAFPTYSYAREGKTLSLYGDVTPTSNAQLSWIANTIRLPQ